MRILETGNRNGEKVVVFQIVPGVSSNYGFLLERQNTKEIYDMMEETRSSNKRCLPQGLPSKSTPIGAEAWITAIFERSQKK